MYEIAPYPPEVRDRVERFTKFCALVGLRLDPFQRYAVAELFAGRRELLVLLPRGNGKTTLFAALALHHLLTVNEAQVYIAAATREQANILFRQAKTLAQRHPGVAKRITFRHNLLRNDANGGFVRVVASDQGGTLMGLAPSLVLVDELHAHPKPDTYIALRTALGKRPESQQVVISTAGMLPKGTLWELREGALALPVVKTEGVFTHTRSLDGKFALLEWSLPQDTDPDSLTPELLKQVNPASFVTVEWLAEELGAPGVRKAQVACWHGNIWGSGGSECWLPTGAWDGCRDPDLTIPEGGKVYVGVDIGIKYDSTAVVWAHKAEQRTIVRARIFEPIGDGTPLELAQVESFIRELGERYAIQGVVFDKWQMHYMAERLSADGLLCLEEPLSHTRMVDHSNSLYTAITEKQIAHDGDPALARHVQAGVTREVGSGWRVDKAKTGEKIDALIALILAHSQMGSAQTVYERRGLLVI